MKLKPFETKESIPEALREYYVERDGKWYPDVDGLKTQEDVDRVKAALEKERDDHIETKRKLSDIPKDFDADKWEKVKDIDPNDPPGAIDPKDEKEINRRISEAVREKEKELQEASRKREEELETEKESIQQKFKDNFLKQWRRNTLAEKFGFSNLDDLDTFLLKIEHSELSDFTEIKRVLKTLEVTDDNGRLKVVGGEYKDDKGAVEALEKVSKMEVSKNFRPAPNNSGGGAGNKGNGNGITENPYKKETLNFTKQGELERDNPDEAKRLAAAAGIDI